MTKTGRSNEDRNRAKSDAKTRTREKGRQAMPKVQRIRIGTSGYNYDHWRGVLYPEDLPKKQWLARYAEVFDTVEINNTFYNLPSKETFLRWASEAPEGFCFVLKFSRYSTHMKKLKDPDQALETFLDRAQLLGHVLGPILVQLPPNWRVNVERLDAFLKAAPKDYRWAVEFRDGSWLCDAVYETLREHNAALCVHDMIEDHPRVRTADWVYLRFHGNNYAGDYSYQALNAVAQRIRKHVADGVEVFAYFNNDAEGCAVNNAQDLKRYLDLV